ncbi:MAG: hypothetical protein OEX79_04480 [Nitrosopumilus sp.]|nr:hypothetical protein [Nitrosopumilus sp.]MDH5554439.1 hypothetical protein [Nitrosopumilus sp.]
MLKDITVIIQIFRNNEVVHFPQANTMSDNDFEYKFRILNINNGVATKIFARSYTVKICKVAYLNQYGVI